MCRVQRSFNLTPISRARFDLNHDGRADGQAGRPFREWILGELAELKVTMFAILLAAQSVAASLASVALQTAMMVRNYIRYFVRAARHLTG